MNEIDVKEGNIIGIVEGNLLLVGDYVDEVILNFIEKLVDEDIVIIILFFGEDVIEF